MNTPLFILPNTKMFRFLAFSRARSIIAQRRQLKEAFRKQYFRLPSMRYREIMRYREKGSLHPW